MKSHGIKPDGGMCVEAISPKSTMVGAARIGTTVKIRDYIEIVGSFSPFHGEFTTP
jgi:hypothetical protein